jgi:ABC-type transport system substrate-binding protein
MKYLWLGSIIVAGCWFLGSCSAPKNQHPAELVRIRWASDPENLSPISLSNQNATDAVNLLYCSLLQRDFSRNAYAPALVDSLPSVRLMGDSLTYLSYQLRKEATWDNGRPVLATDVDFTLKLMQCPGLPNEGTRAQYDFIKSVRFSASNPRRFTLVCQGQAPEYVMVSGDFAILPEAVLDSAHTLRRYSIGALSRQNSASQDSALLALVKRYQQLNLARHPDRLPGCGPYQLTSWNTNHSLTFQRKKKWWADQLHPTPLVLQAQPKQIQFRIISDEAAATLALRRHEVDVYPQVPAQVFERLKAAVGQEFSYYAVPSYEMDIAGFNTQRPILRDKLTRKALSYLFDPVQLLKATQLGLGSRTVGFVHPLEREYYHDSLPLLTYAPARTLALLKQAGWQRNAKGWQRQTTSSTVLQRLSLTLHYRASESTFETIALQFKAAAEALGIPVELRPTEPTVLRADLEQGNFDIYVRTMKGSPQAFNFKSILHSQSIGAGNSTRFGTPASDRLIESIATSGEQAQKRHLLRTFQVIMQDEMPLVPLFVLPYRLAADRRLRNVYPSALRPGYAAAALEWAPADSAIAHLQ